MTEKHPKALPSFSASFAGCRNFPDLAREDPRWNNHTFARGNGSECEERVGYAPTRLVCNRVINVGALLSQSGDFCTLAQVIAVGTPGLSQKPQPPASMPARASRAAVCHRAESKPSFSAF
jgi:hypothetical protein